MLGLFGKKTDHPLADPKSAQQLLDALPKNDALKTLQEITEWIESLRADENFRLDDRFAALRLLDETARPHERKLTRDLYSASALSAFQQNRLLMVLDEFTTQLSRAYGEVLAACRDGNKGAVALKPQQPLIAARAIHAAMGRLKCATARYAQVEPDVWSLLAACYAGAESGQYLDEPVALYPGATSTVACEFASVLLWWASGTGTLKPQQAHLAERLTSHLCHSYTVQAQPVAGSAFSFDLSRAEPPLRYTGEAAVSGSMRFIVLGQVQAQLDSLIRTLDKGIVPDDINLGGSYDVEILQDVAKRLLVFWSSSPPKRRAPRRRISVNLHVASGFSGVIEQTGVGLNFGKPATDNWEVDDMSSNGFRCVLPAAQGDKVQIGLLIGIRPEKIEQWGAGIVRRLVRNGDSQLHVGVEMLSTRVEGVLLHDSGLAGAEEEPALWLTGNGYDEGEAWLMMQVDSFLLNRSLQMQAEEKRFLLMPLALVERGEDFDFARYRKIEQDTSGEAEAY